jgi:hypothetical protein
VTIDVQDDDGSETSAVSYLDATDFAAYHLARGNVVPVSSTAQKEAALVRATDYLDQRFRYRGEKLTGNTQSTEFPRMNAYDNAGRAIYGIPKAVKDATAEYALRSLADELNPDPVRDTSGRRVIAVSETIGPLSSSFTYANGGGLTGAAVLPEYPAADMKLVRAGLTTGDGIVSCDVRRA